MRRRYPRIRYQIPEPTSKPAERHRRHRTRCRCRAVAPTAARRSKCGVQGFNHQYQGRAFGLEFVYSEALTASAVGFAFLLLLLKGPLHTFCNAVFARQADFCVRQKINLSGYVFITSAVGDCVLRDLIVLSRIAFLKLSSKKDGSQAGVIFVIVRPDVRIVRRRVVSMAGLTYAPGAGRPVKPLVNI